MAARLIAHLQRNDLQEPLQSAYKQYYSIETALLKVQNDIRHILDKRKGAALLLLDLNAAFDTIDHVILLHTLQHEIGITGECLRWIQCYLKDRGQAVRISEKQSKHTPLKCGVPQGSVLEPLLFSIYTIPLARITKIYKAYQSQLWLIISHFEFDQVKIIQDISLCETAHFVL